MSFQIFGINAGVVTEGTGVELKNLNTKKNTPNQGRVITANTANKLSAWSSREYGVRR